MTQFYKEITPSGFGIAIKQKEVLFSEQSPFQKVEIFESDSTLGRVLTLDDLMMTTEGDEYHYHEMIAHIPMMQHKNPESVLVIGGGDGGTVREVLKHKTVKKVVNKAKQNKKTVDPKEKARQQAQKKFKKNVTKVVNKVKKIFKKKK